MKKLRIGIIILVIIIIAIIATVVIIKNKSEEEFEVVGDESNLITQIDNSITKVTNRNKFYVVKTIIERYFENYSNENIISKLYDNSVDEKSKDDVTLKNMSMDNMVIQNMYNSELENSINLYFVDLDFLDKNKQISLIIKTDNKNLTFSVFPYKYITANSITAENFSNTVNTTQVEVKEVNKFKYINISNEQHISELHRIFKSYIVYAKEKLYNKLDETYRDKRFGTLENLNKYISDNISELYNIRFDEYSKQETDGIVQYICRDQYQNYYIFSETAILNYTLKLDPYTIEDIDYADTYKSADSVKKIQMNVFKWISMLNCRDYSSAYNKLDETFKKNNFPTLLSFENYIKEKYPLHYSLEYVETTMSGEIYIQTIKLTDLTGVTKREKQLNIIMKLDEENGFVMSFTV